MQRKLETILDILKKNNQKLMTKSQNIKNSKKPSERQIFVFYQFYTNLFSNFKKFKLFFH